MKYPTDIIKFISDIISAMDFTAKILKADEDNKGNFILTLSDIFHAQPCFDIEIDGAKYNIVSTDENCSQIVVSGKSIPQVNSTFQFACPKLFHGTTQAVNNETNPIKYTDKFPMVFMVEPFLQSWDNKFTSAFERETELIFCFLTQANFNKFTTNDFYSNCIRPMEKLMHNFISALEKNKRISRPLSNFDTVNRTKFGVYIADKGAEKNIFADNLSGIELKINLKIYKDNCKEC